MKYTFLIFLCACIVLGVSSYALINPNFFRVHDFTQGARIVEMERAFADGQIPPRWSKNFGFGYGMPTFLFYAPFPYLLPAFVYWLTNNMSVSLQVFWFLPSLVSFIAMYALVKRFMGRAAALIAGTAFTLAPYRAVDLFVRGAVGEVWGMMFFPVITLALIRYIEKPTKNKFLTISLSIALLMISHNLMALMFLPFILLLGTSFQAIQFLINNKSNQLVKKAIGWLSAIGVGGLLSVFYVIPALTENKETQITARILGGYFHYSQHFMYIRQFFVENWKYGGSSWGPNDDVSFFLGYGQLMLLFFAVVMLVVISLKYIFVKKNLFSFLDKFVVFPISQRDKMAYFFSIVSFIGFALSCFFAVMRSIFIWDHIALMQTIQFPWRFLSTAIFFLAILCGFAVHAVKRKKLRYVFTAVLFVVLILPAMNYFHPEKYAPSVDTYYYTDEGRIQREMSSIWPDFLPKQFNEKLPPTQTRFSTPDGGQHEKEVKVVIDRSQQLLLRTSFTQPTVLTLHIADFPGWTTFLNAKEVQHSVNKDGLIELMVPAGEQAVAADFRDTPVRFISGMISVATLLIVLFSSLYFDKGNNA